jgi:hypothetical protein
VVQAVSCQSIIAEARVHTKTFLCGICGRQIGIGRTWVFPVSTIPQALHTHSPMILLTQSEKLTAQLNNKDRMDKLLLKSNVKGIWILRNISWHKWIHVLYVLHVERDRSQTCEIRNLTKVKIANYLHPCIYFFRHTILKHIHTH